MRRRWVARGLKFAAIAIVATGAFGFIVMNLWNWLAPDVFGARPIDFWQAIGLLVLSRILLGGVRGPGRRMHWREPMTPEEREKFREGMRGRCCGATTTGNVP